MRPPIPSTDRLPLTVSAATGVVLAAAMWSAYGWTLPTTIPGLSAFAATAAKAATLGVTFLVAAIAPRLFAWQVLGGGSAGPRHRDPGDDPKSTDAADHA